MSRSSSRVMRPIGVALVAGALALATPVAARADTTTPGTTAASPLVTSPVDVPVLGSLKLVTEPAGDGAADGLLLLNAVRRVDGGTAVYYAAGFPDADTMPSTWGESVTSGYVSGEPSEASVWGRVKLVDPATGTVYPVLTAADQTHTLATAEVSEGMDQAGLLYSFFAVTAALPDTVKTVDVVFGDARTVPGVAVGDGALTPTVSVATGIPLGYGWPAVDTATIQAASSAAASIAAENGTSDTVTRSLIADTSNADGTVTTSVTGTWKTVSIADSLLFGDGDTVTAEGSDVLKSVAASIDSEVTGGTVSITGYTDSSVEYNEALSSTETRAAAVRKALTAVVTNSGVLLTSSGGGWSNQVTYDADESDLNRRIEIGYSLGDD